MIPPTTAATTITNFAQAQGPNTNPLIRFQQLCDPRSETTSDDVELLFRNLCISCKGDLKKTLEEQPDLLKKTDSKQQTLLHHLANTTALKHTATPIQLALQQGASVTSRDSSGHTPIHTAIRRLGDDRCIILETLPTLLDAVRDEDIVPLIATPDSSGDTLLHLASKYEYVFYNRLSYDLDRISCVPKFLQMLKEHTTKDEFINIVNACNKTGCTALDFAFAYKSKDAFSALVLAGAVLPQKMVQTEKDKNAEALSETECEEISRKLSLSSSLDEKIHDLHYILKPVRVGDSQEFIWSLLRAAIDTLDNSHLNHASSIDGYTFLHLGVLARDIQSVQKLLDRGAQVNLKNYNGVTPINLAVLNGNSAIYSILKKQKGALWTPSAQKEGDTMPPELEIVSMDTSAEIAQDLLGQYNVKDVNKSYRYKINDQEREITLLELAFAAGSYEWVLLLLQLGAKIESFKAFSN